MPRSPDEPEKLRKPEMVASLEFARWRRLVRAHPCPVCRGKRVLCSTCNGTRVDPAFAVWDDEEGSGG